MEMALGLPPASVLDRRESIIWKPLLIVLLLIGFFSMHVLVVVMEQTPVHAAHGAHGASSGMHDEADPVASIEADVAGGIHEAGTCLSSTPTSAGGHPADPGSERVLPPLDVDGAASQGPPSWIHGYGLFSLCVVRR
ncbi:MAG: hypothetical protein ACLGHL_03205 [Actinomycetota bacterium]